MAVMEFEFEKLMPNSKSQTDSFGYLCTKNANLSLWLSLNILRVAEGRVIE